MSVVPYAHTKPLIRATNVSIITSPSTPFFASKLRTWLSTLTCGNDVQILDLGDCDPQLGLELDRASYTQRLIGDSQWPCLVHEALGGSSSASLGRCSIFIRVCPDGDAA